VPRGSLAWSGPAVNLFQPIGGFSVKDWGAKGDGVTDDAGAINAAIAACQANGGGIVYLPASLGNAYAIGSPIVPVNDVEISGVPGASFKWIGAAGGAMLQSSVAGGPLVRSGLYCADGGRFKLNGNNLADLVMDLHSPQEGKWGAVEVRNIRNTTIVLKLRTDVASAAGSIDGTQNALECVFEEIFVQGTCLSVVDCLGTVGKVITRCHFEKIDAKDVQGAFGINLQDYCDSCDFGDCRLSLTAANAAGINFGAANVYNHHAPDFAVDTFGGVGGRVCVVFGSGSSRNELFVFNNPRAELGLFTDNGALSYKLEAHSVDPDAPAGAIELHEKGYVNYGQTVHVRTMSANGSLTAEDSLVNGVGGAGGITITLPPATNKGQRLMIKKSDAGAGAVTISRAGADTIQGANTIALAAQWASRVLVADGVSTWEVESNQ
jgi:Pectate lyase superfamily protein